MLVGVEILELIYDLVGYVEVGCDFGNLRERVITSRPFST